jgi:hypothetical protein
MDVWKGVIVVRMTYGVIKPMLIAILAHLEYYSLRLHIFDKVTNKFRIISYFNLLFFGDLLLPWKLGIVNAHGINLFLEIL